MTYQSLYRRYRPRRFGEVRGQAHVVAALRNAVAEDRVAHAYLFSGPRGTGKTSTARILARALNCINLTGGEPCLECDSCIEIEAGKSYDLHELDAASNNGVDAMRDLITKAALGSPGRTKVYILDEVHMLSPAASNALLKTLEEPPGHVVFILATTDPHKVLATIRSRAQHLEFHLLPAEELEEHVRWVVSDAGLDVDDEGVEHVLLLGAGSARDTLSALDQVAAAGGVIDKPGAPEALLDALIERDTGRAIAAVAEAMAAGRDPRVLGESLLAQVRDVFLTSMGAGLDHLSDRQREHIDGLAERVERPFVTRSLEVLGEALVDMRQAPDPRVSLEVALVRLTNPQSDTSIAALVERIDRLEQALASGGLPSASAASAPAAAAAAPAPTTSAPASRPAADDSRPVQDAPPSSRRTGPAAQAREELAKHGSGAPVGGDGKPAPSETASAPGSTSRPTLGAMRQAAGRSAVGAPAEVPSAADGPAPAEAPQAPAPPPPPSPEPEPPALAPAPAKPTGDPGQLDLPTRDELTLAWADVILKQLPGAAKARFSPGRFLATEAGHAVFALPTDMQLNRCKSVQGEVERTLAAHFGRPVPLRLITDAGGAPAREDRVASKSAPARQSGSDSGRASGGAGRGGGRSDRGATPEPPPGYDDYDGGPPESLDDIDWDSLDDAPPSSNSTGIDLLAEAFPGSELLEEPNDG